ncbi:hypothetical protein B0J11DRAFT_60526 [Dendryphion nanum]|uniref:LysM domain-containing protein n=1 Tax=Dendryphion nanum TaxID=256645 RepID=A0A9P9DME1_9PLEO|nr:hypothetical protein B0J11DRAFT_60526 [Dendryphion nanum]
MHPTNGSPSSKTSSTPTASTLRPRTRRLISIDDELGTTSGSDNGASPFGSRTASPAPGSRPLRNTLTSNPSSFVRSASAQASEAGRNTSTALSGLWGNSWTAIQGLTSNVLGNDATPKNVATRKRKPPSSAHRRTASSAPPAQWGPTSSSSSHIGAGSQEERESLVRAMKRKDLLSANERLVSDSVGRIKRRTSDDLTSSSAPPAETEDRDALVYIHAVRPQDTLAGISIKYNCEQAVLRKANRLWPNDSVQIKKTVLLPVDACGVKGRPVDGPDSLQEDLLLDYGNNTNTIGTDRNTLPSGWTSSKPQTTSNQRPPSSSHSNSNADPDPPWKHDSWVLLPNDSKATQIGRMPRNALGFFPPARRKSVTFSDATPKQSFDLPRSSTSTNATNTQSASPNPKVRPPSRTTSFSNPPGRHRSNSHFSLHGPGGVGTMGRNVRSPGPAQDGLNKLFAAHLPSVAPPPGQEYFTPWAPSLLEADSGTAYHHGGSGAHTPLSNAGLDLQEIGGAIEGWVRKVGTQASKLLSEPSTPGQGKRSAVPVIGAVGGDLGDLIELRDDAFEIDEDERDRFGPSGTMIPTAEQFQIARPDINLVIRERGRKGVSSKSD